MYCPECGGKLKENAKFCVHCGASLTKEETEKEEKEFDDDVEEEGALEVEEVSQKSEEVEEKPKKSSKNSKKRMLVIGGICVLIIAIVVGVLLLGQSRKNNEPIDEVWGNKYYVYLKDIKENDRQKDAALPEKINKGKISFYDVDDFDEPIMTITYEKNGKTYLNLYYIKKGKVNVYGYKEPTDIKFLYDILEKEYDYYSHTVNDEEEVYRRLTEKVNEGKSYTFTNEEESREYEQTFVEPKVEHEEYDYDYEMDDKKLKDLVQSGVDEFQDQKEIVTDKVEKDVKKQVEEIEKEKEEETEDVEEVSKGLKTLKEALEYSLGVYFVDKGGEISVSDSLYRGFGTALGLLEEKNSVKASELPEKMITQFLYNYSSKDNFIIDKTYTEDEIKQMLFELYGKNYTYDHPLTDQNACTSLVYSDSLGRYSASGGCGGVSMEYDPYYFRTVLSISKGVVTIGSIYVEPTEGPDHYEAVAPYEIYTDSKKTKKITSLDHSPTDDELSEIAEESGVKYKITFDQKNGFYYFNNMKKVQ